MQTTKKIGIREWELETQNRSRQMLNNTWLIWIKKGFLNNLTSAPNLHIPIIFAVFHLNSLSDLKRKDYLYYI